MLSLPPEREDGPPPKIKRPRARAHGLPSATENLARKSADAAQRGAARAEIQPSLL